MGSIAELLTSVVAMLCAIGLFFHFAPVWRGLPAPAAVPAPAPAPAPAAENRDVFTVTILKKPVAREETNHLVIYRYRMSGTKNYQWVVVADEKAKALVPYFLAGSGFTAGAEGLGVETLAAHVAGLSGADREQEAAQAAADLRTHDAVVYSYENP